MNKMYRDETTLEQILRDGWSRGFEPEQTLEEAAAMGFNICYEDLDIAWNNFQTEMEAYFEVQYEEDDPNDPWSRAAEGGWLET